MIDGRIFLEEILILELRIMEEDISIFQTLVFRKISAVIQSDEEGRIHFVDFF